MNFIVALTGASGQLYALRLLRKLAASGADISLVLSEPACVSMAAESNIKLNAHRPDLTQLFEEHTLGQVRVFNPREVGAPIASGSNRHDGMVVIPCSMGTLGRIANGTSEDLITRAADVCLKERRKLILVAREMPLSLVHIRNMAAVTEAGALVLPACPHFYHQPQTVDEVLDTVVDRVLDQLSVETNTKRWRAEEKVAKE
jgi:4-hydroxy-3-polyprenylbenzoate decarboxylase